MLSIWTPYLSMMVLSRCMAPTASSEHPHKLDDYHRPAESLSEA